MALIFVSPNTALGRNKDQGHEYLYLQVIKCSTILQIVPERNAEPAVNRHNLENCATSGNLDIVFEMEPLRSGSRISEVGVVNPDSLHL